MKLVRKLSHELMREGGEVMGLAGSVMEEMNDIGGGGRSGRDGVRGLIVRIVRWNGIGL